MEILNSQKRNSVSNEDVPNLNALIAKWSTQTVEDRLLKKNSYRELHKPLYARFKIKLRYRLTPDGRPTENDNVLFSYDWLKKYCINEGINPILRSHPDNEEVGLAGLLMHCIREHSKDNLIKFKIYCNSTELKDTSKMNYNYEVFRWNETLGFKGMDLDNKIKELKFDPLTHKVDLDLLQKYVHIKTDLR